MGRRGAHAGLIVTVMVLALGWAAAPALAGLTIGTAHRVNIGALSGVSCSTPTSCEATAGNAVIAINPNGVAGTGVALPGNFLGAIGCAGGTSNCEAVGHDGSNHGANAPISAGVPGSLHTYPNIVSALNGVACAPGGNACVAVGYVDIQGSPNVYHSLVVPITNGVQSPGQYTPSPTADQVAMDRVACPGNNCVAVGQGGAVWSLSVSGGASAAHYPTGTGFVGNLVGVACATASSCLAVGSAGAIVPITNGTPGAQQFVPDVGPLVGIACPSASTCLAVGGSKEGRSILVPITNGTPGTPIDVTGTGTGFLLPEDIACAGPNCLVVGSPGGNAGVVLPISTATSTSTTLSSSANPSAAGQPVTFTATISPSGGAPPTGSVSFSDGSTSLGTTGVSGGSARLTTSSLSAGTHVVTASYAGDANYAPSTSLPLSQSVTPVQRTLSVSFAGNGAGKVSGTGLSCTGRCSARYANGTSVTLSATPKPGSAFAGWSGACHGTGSCVVRLNSDQGVTATFRVPAVSRVRLSPGAFPAAPTGRRRSSGTTVSYTLNVAATVRFTITQAVPARRPGRGRHTVTLGSFTRSSQAGRDSFHFSGRLHGRKLPPGSYTLVLAASTHGRTGRAVSTGFRIIR